jgi:hypothetical protein
MNEIKRITSWHSSNGAGNAKKLIYKDPSLIKRDIISH